MIPSTHPLLMALKIFMNATFSMYRDSFYSESHSFSAERFISLKQTKCSEVPSRRCINYFQSSCVWYDSGKRNQCMTRKKEDGKSGQDSCYGWIKGNLCGRQHHQSAGVLSFQIVLQERQTLTTTRKIKTLKIKRRRQSSAWSDDFFAWKLDDWWFSSGREIPH